MIKSGNVLDIFAERLKELIKEKGWTIQEFSLYIHIPRTTINSWLLKQKSPKIDYLCNIADFLKFPRIFCWVEKIIKTHNYKNSSITKLKTMR